MFRFRGSSPWGPAPTKIRFRCFGTWPRFTPRKLFGDSNLPRRAWRELLASNETIGQPAMNAAGVHAGNLRRFANGNQLPIRRRRGGWNRGMLRARIVQQAPPEYLPMLETDQQSARFGQLP
jgi:hypothetical protein